MDKETKCCPMCSGTGQILKDNGIPNARKYARKLRKAGKSWREIANVMGYKSHNSIKHLVNKDA